MKYFIVMAIKESTIYLWDYISNEYYVLNSTEFDYSIYDVIEVETKNIEVINESSVIKYKPEDSRIIGKTILPLLLDKMNIIVGRQTTSFKRLLDQRNEKRRIISLVKFSGSMIKNGQLRIKHGENNYSYCDILDNDLREKEGSIYCGKAIVEYIPGKKKERSFNLIYSVNNRFKNRKNNLSKIKYEDSKIELAGDSLYSLFASNKDYYEEIEIMLKKEQERYNKEQEEYDKRIEENFILFNFGEGRNEESYEDYFDDDILGDIINVGFDDWDISIDEDDQHDHEMDSWYNNYETDSGYEDDKSTVGKEDLYVLDSNNVIIWIDELLGKFKIYRENNIKAKTFATDTSYVTVNLLHPEGLFHIAHRLREIKDLDPEILTRYDSKVKKIIETFKVSIPNLRVPSMVDIGVKGSKYAEPPF